MNRPALVIDLWHRLWAVVAHTTTTQLDANLGTWNGDGVQDLTSLANPSWPHVVELVNLTALVANHMALIAMTVDATTAVVHRGQVWAIVAETTKRITYTDGVVHLYVLGKKLKL